MSADAAAAEGAEGSSAAPAPSKPAPTKVAYHPNVRCVRGGGRLDKHGFTYPVIVGPMYRVGEGQYVCEEKATEEEKTGQQRTGGASRWRGWICATGKWLTSHRAAWCRRHA